MKFAISKIRFEPSAIESISLEIDRYPDVETGGVLLGYYDNNLAIIKKATGAGPKALRERFDFKCDVAYTDMLIDMEFANSKGTTYYIGEWHSHPQKKPFPSETDLNSLDNISATSSSSFGVLVIVGFIGYTSDRFLEQSIAITKCSDDEQFYELPREIIR